MKSGSIEVQWAGAFPYTLTTSYVASDPVNIDYADSFTIYPYYSAGSAETNNTIQYTVELNPLDGVADSGNLFWQPNTYETESPTGTFTKQDITYNGAQGTAGTYQATGSLTFQGISASRVRIKVKESGVASNAGTVKFYIAKSNRNI